MSSPPPGDKRSPLEKRLAVAHHLPSLAFFSLLAVSLSAAAFVVWPVTGGTRRAALASGPVSNHHRLIETACERCHAAPFAGASDDRCLGCHTVGAHAEALTNKKAHVGAAAVAVDRCAACHKEHHGQRSLVPVDSPLCTGCHAQMPKILPDSKQPSVGDFAHHPEFSVRFNTSAGLEKVRLDAEGARDDTPLKFSHAEHLGQVKRRGGAPEKMVCTSCHAPAADGKGFVPVEFEHNCQRCHALVFDERLRDKHVPHGDAARAVEFIAAAIAEFNLNSDQGSAEKTDKLRERVDQESHDAVDALFVEQDGCKRCHEVSSTPAPGAPTRKRYEVQSLKLRRRWMPGALFDHGVHRQTACEQCHTRARSSTSAGDLLMPGIQTCRQCHADPGTPDKIDSPCVECHAFHAKK